MKVFLAFSFFVIGLLSVLFSYFFLFLLLPLFFFFYYHKTPKKTVVIYLFFTLLGIALVLLYPKGNENASELAGMVVTRKENYYLLLTLQGKYYVYDKGESVPLFSLVKLTGYISHKGYSHYESSFSFPDYLKTQGVFYSFQAKTTTFIFQSPISTKGIQEYLFSFLNDESKIIVSSLLFGDSLYDLESISAFQEMGMVSALSLSGFHLSFLLGILRRTIGKNHEKGFSIFELALLSVFLFFSFFRYTIRRIFLLSLFRFLKERNILSLSYIDRVALTGFILLVIEPYSFLSASFYYSFPLLFFLAFFPLKREENLKGKISFFVRLTLFFLPYRFFTTSYFSLLSPIFQFLLIPYSHLLFLSSILLFLCPPFGFVLNYLILFFVKIVSFSAPNLIQINTGQPSVIFFVVYYLLLILFSTLKSYSFQKQSKYALLSLSLVIATCFIPDIFPHYEVTFIDVDQGDSTLIRNGYQNILIDTGGLSKVDLATESLIPYFAKKKISHLDAVLITHNDYDHVGALTSLQKHFKVDMVYYASDFLTFPDETYSFGDFKIKNLNTYFQTVRDENTKSGVFSFQVKETKFLVMGDAPKEVEYEILKDKKEIDCDILKVGHHGSSTSSSSSFVKACSPRLAIISCGYQNKYGHPDKEVISTLTSLSIPYRRTDLEGSITISC